MSDTNINENATKEVKEFSINSFLDEKTVDNMQVIIFEIENVEFAIDIMDVKEIKEMERIRRLPNAQAFVQGLLNLRGDIIPIIDLKKRLELDNLGLQDIKKLTQLKNLKNINKDDEQEENFEKDNNNENIKEINSEKDEELNIGNTEEENFEEKEYTQNKLEEDLNSFGENISIPEELRDKNIIICNIENTMFGILIDRIVQVSYLNREQFEPAPKLISSVGEKFLGGFAKVKGKIIPILNLYELIFRQD